MSRRLRFPILSALVGAALLAVGCSEPLDPGRRAVSPPRFATAAADPIALDQVNGTFGEGLACAPCNPSVLRKGFNPTHPHNGDAIIATFFWISTPPGGNIITEVNDSLADGFTRVGNTYTLVDFVTAGNVAMATYVATDVQNIPQGTFPTGENVLLVSARLSVPVADGGVLISAWTGVAPDLAAALGETRHASGTGTGRGRPIRPARASIPTAIPSPLTTPRASRLRRTGASRSPGCRPATIASRSAASRATAR